MNFKNLFACIIFILALSVTRGQTTSRPHTVSISCSCPSPVDGAIKTTTDSSVTIISSNFSTITIPHKEIKKVAIYPPKRKTVPGLMYIGGVMVMGGSFYQDDVKSGVYTALTGIGITFLGYVTEKLFFKPIYRKTIKDDADLSELKLELTKYQLP